jgi:hypothetical protein
MGSFALANWVDKKTKATTSGRNLGMLLSGVCKGIIN